MPALNGCLQYVIPDNLTPLLSALVGRSLKHDTRLAGYNSHLAKVHAAISQMEQMRKADPNWFDNSHVRVPITASPRNVLTPQSMDELPLVSVPEIIDTVSQPLLSPDEESVHADDDSGVFDKTGILPSTSTVDITEDQDIQAKDGENEHEPVIIIEEISPDKKENKHELLHISNPLTRLINHEDPPYNKLKEIEPDCSADSGLVSDADLRMISAS